MATINQLRNRVVGNGQTRKQEYHGIFAFTTTGATKNVVVPFEKVEDVQVTYVGTPALADGPISWNNTISGTVGNDDACAKGSNGSTTIVVTRVAGSTSGQKFSFRAIGY